MSDTKPNFSKEVFWDVNYNKIDWDRNASFVIDRIILEGFWEDWIKLVQFYGFDKIKESVIKSRYLDKKSLSFCSAIFNIPIENFRCYTMREFSPKVWEF